jgi:hypothetical protein
MFFPALRIAAFLAITVTVFSLVAIGFGHQVDTSTLTVHEQINNHVYALYIRDLRTNVALRLSGTRCFEAPPIDPEWIALRQQYETNYVQIIQVRSFDTDDAVRRLQCPRHEPVD